MKKIGLSLIFLLALFVIPLQGSANTAPQVMQVTSETMNVKSEANANSKNVTQVKKGNLLIVTETTGQFSKVNVNGQTGYIATTGLSNLTPKQKIVTRKNGQVIKAMPNSSAKNITTLQAASVVEDYGKVNDTYHLVQYGSVTGYAHKDTMKATSPTARFINGQSVTIYSAANAKSAVRDSLTFGTKVNVHTTVGGWAYVTAGSKRGYIAKSFLVTKKPVQLKGDKVAYSSIQHDIRYSTTLRDLAGNKVTVHFIAINDSYKRATWDDSWAGVAPNDQLYTGTFKIGLQQANSQDVYIQSYTFRDYTYNKTQDVIFRIQGKTASDTDFLVVSQIEASVARSGQLFYYTNGSLKKAEDSGWFLRPKSIGNQQYQLGVYSNSEQFGYHFLTEKFNPTTGKFTLVKMHSFAEEDGLFDVGRKHAEKFSTNPSYYVK